MSETLQALWFKQTTFAVDYFLLMGNLPMIAFHLVICELIKAAVSAGVLVSGMAPAFSKAAVTSGSAMARPMALLSLFTIAADVPLGANRAFHVLIS